MTYDRIKMLAKEKTVGNGNKTHIMMTYDWIKVLAGQKENSGENQHNDYI